MDNLYSVLNNIGSPRHNRLYLQNIQDLLYIDVLTADKSNLE